MTNHIVQVQFLPNSLPGLATPANATTAQSADSAAGRSLGSFGVLSFLADSSVLSRDGREKPAQQSETLGHVSVESTPRSDSGRLSKNLTPGGNDPD